MGRFVCLAIVMTVDLFLCTCLKVLTSLYFTPLAHDKAHGLTSTVRGEIRT